MRGKSVCVVNDLTIEEQLHLYQVSRDIKAKISHNEFPKNDKNMCAYLMFLEDSTRTKESFRNAAETLSFRTNMFDSANSSLNKFETLNDTVRMLCGYTAMPSVYIIRSKIEGLCQSLADSIGEYAGRTGLHAPSFVNAGDGRHEHPTQEFLDEFTFLDQLKGDTSAIHIALVGDLRFGRTIHSKADGLRIFKKVEVDLVAPDELQLPSSYVDKMRQNGFKLNFFTSLDEYMKSPGAVAPILYFTRLQLERMDKSTLEKESSLRRATTLRLDQIPSLPVDAKIYHPLPRHGELPEIPFEFDKTSFNGYDEQSRNGYFVRTALLGLLTGHYPAPAGTDAHVHHLPCGTLIHSSILDESVSVERSAVNPILAAFAESVPTETVAWLEVKLPQQSSLSLRKLVSQLQALFDLETGLTIVESDTSIVSLPLGLVKNDPKFLTVIHLLFQGCQPVVFWEDKKGEFKMISKEVSLETISDLPGIGCRNKACVSHPDSKQRDVKPVFHLLRANGEYACRYCEAQAFGPELFV